MLERKKYHVDVKPCISSGLHLYLNNKVRAKRIIHSKQ